MQDKLIGKKLPLDNLFLATLLCLFFIILLAFVLQNTGADFTVICEQMPLSRLIKKIPLVSISEHYAILEYGPQEASKLVFVSTAFAYVFVISNILATVYVWSKTSSISGEKLSPQLLYWMAFVASIIVTLVFYPAVWHANSIAYRLATQSSFKFFFWGLLVLASNLVTAFGLTFVRQKLSS